MTVAFLPPPGANETVTIRRAVGPDGHPLLLTDIPVLIKRTAEMAMVGSADARFRFKIVLHPSQRYTDEAGTDIDSIADGDTVSWGRWLHGQPQGLSDIMHERPAFGEGLVRGYFAEYGAGGSSD